MHRRILLVLGLALTLTWWSTTGLADPPKAAEAEQPPPRQVEAPPRQVEPGRPSISGRRPGRRLDADDVKDALQVLLDHRPQLADKIDEWQKQNPEVVVELLSDHMRWLIPEVDRYRNDPQDYALRLADMQFNQRAEILARQINEQRKQSVDTASAERELRQVLTEQFEVRQQLRRHALAKFERSINELRSQLDERQKSRADLIKAREQQLAPKPGEERPRVEW